MRKGPLRPRKDVHRFLQILIPEDLKNWKKIKKHLKTQNKHKVMVVFSRGSTPEKKKYFCSILPDFKN